MKIQAKITEIRELIADDKLEAALRELIQLTKKHREVDNIILQSARYSEISDVFRKGIVSFKETQVTKNQIRLALLEILHEIEEKNQADKATPQRKHRKRKIGLAVSAGVLLIVAGTFFLQSILLEKIEGRVINERNGNAIPEAIVWLLKDGADFKETTTNWKGEFRIRFSRKFPKPYKIRIEKAGLDTLTIPIRFNQKIDYLLCQD